MDEQRAKNAVNGEGYLTDEEVRQKKLFEESLKEGYVPVEVSVRTTENKFNLDFFVPKKMYLEPKYRERLNNARTLEEVDYLVKNYKKHMAGNQTKHWWQ